jgi:hypothetical protein
LHAQELAIARQGAKCRLDVLRLFAFAAFAEGRNFVLAQLFDGVCLVAVGLHQLLANDHPHEADLVRQFLELQLQIAREEVLSCITKPVRLLPSILDAKE